MRVGFTGTQEGMTVEQARQVYRLLCYKHLAEAHHGDCKGSDEAFHWLAVSRGLRIHLHPPIKEDKRAFCSWPVEVLWQAKDYLDRDLEIVINSDVLIGTPKGYTNQRRSGTWFTLREASKRNLTVYIVYPNGKIAHDLPKMYS